MLRVFRIFTLAALAAAPVLVACDAHEGPAERAGKKIDHAADRAADAIQDATRR
jgi:hypothetical protein